ITRMNVSCVQVIANPLERSGWLVLVVFVLIAGLLAGWPLFGGVEELGQVIAEQQKKNVKESWGVFAYQCFTWDDLAAFKSANQPARIAQSVKSDQRFFDAVAAVKAIPADQRASALDVFRKPLRPTWARQGFIGPSGQTDAGQQAELLIANAIVDLAMAMVR